MERLKAIFSKLMANKDLVRGETVNIDISDLEWLCSESIKTLKKEATLLRLRAPINVVGDVHGQFTDLMQFLNVGGLPPSTRYLFLGDYVDRGANSIETITTLLCLKNLYPNKVHLLRGNHETRDISQMYGFYDECCSRYNESLWDKFNDVFGYLPLAAVISDRIFCVHGGLSGDLKDVSRIENIKRPFEVPESGFIADLLWADPDGDVTGLAPSERGTSFKFGADVADSFLKQHDFDLICRAHQVVNDGFEFPFWPEQSVVTIFSAPNYCEEFGNKGAMLSVDEELRCSFKLVEPPSGSRENGYTRPATPSNFMK